MKLLKQFVLLTIFGLSASVNAQTIIVQKADGTNPRTFTSIDAAVADADPDDYVYLERGTYDITSAWTGYDGTLNQLNHLVVEKPLHFVGNGYYYPAEATAINGTFSLRKSASGSTITGIKFNNNVNLDSISNVVITRCSINENNTYLYLCGTGTGNIITECMIFRLHGRPSITATAGSNANTWSSYANTVISKNIFKNNDSMGYHRNLFIYNNAFVSSGNTLILSCDNITVKNNTLTANGPSCINNNLTNSIIQNNISVYALTQNATNTYQDNIVETTGNTFVSFNSSGTGDYHLKTTSLGVGAGSDGTDIGIYGTFSPFKENRRTAYPRVTAFNIGSETNPNGELRVNATVEAQDY